MTPNENARRICRARGHKWTKPHATSHFYSQRKHAHDRRCSRCGVWESQLEVRDGN